MKNLVLMNNIRMVGVTCTLLLAINSFAQNQITMTMSDPVNVTATSFEFDINVANTGTTSLKLSAGQPQIKQVGTNIPVAPTTPTYTVVYEGPVFASLNNPTPSYNNSTFRISQSPIGNYSSAIDMPVSATVEYHVKIQSNSGNITYPVTLQLSTTTPNITLSAYVVQPPPNNTTTFSLAAGNLVLGPNLTINAPLPVELTDVEAIAQPTNNLVRWSTASELNSQFHIVERSADGIDNWVEIGRKKAAGTTTSEQHYFLNDEQPLAMSYYRLKLLDYDGKYEYSNIVSVERDVQDFEILKTFPSPTSGKVSMQVNLPDPGILTITVSDNLGRVVQLSELDAIKGLNELNLNLTELPEGMYNIKLDNGIDQLIERVLKQD